MDLIDFLTSRPLYLKTAKKHCVYHIIGSLISILYITIILALAFIVFINDDSMIDLAAFEKHLEKAAKFGGLMYLINCVVFKIHEFLVSNRWQNKIVLESLSMEKKKNPATKDPQTLEEYVDGFTNLTTKYNTDKILEEVSIVNMTKEIRYLKGIIECILGPTQTNIRNEVI